MGALCADGAVLMADQQISVAGGLKHYRNKTWSFSTAFYHVSSVYAGIPEMARLFQMEFERNLPRNPFDWKPSQNNLQDLIKKCLRKVWKDHGSNMELAMLLCTRAQGKYKMWKSNGKVLTDTSLDCIGIGETSVVRYFIGTFPRAGQFTKLEYFVPFGLYVMQQAKKYVRGCGGRTDCIVFQEGKISYLTNPRPIKEVEEEMESLEGEVVNLFAKYSASSMKQEDFADVLEKFSARIEQIRRAGKLNRLFA
jgi:hypothetical protein